MKRKLLSLGTVMVALASSPVVADSWEDKAKDAWIDGKAETVLLFNTDLSSFDINTDVRDGVVILTGKVESEHEKRYATELIRSLDGVKDVENNLTVVLDKDEWRKTYAERRRAAWDDDRDEMDQRKMKHKGKMKDKHGEMKDKDHSDMDHSRHHDKDRGEWDEDDFVSEFVDSKITSVLSTKMLFEGDLESGDIDVEVENGVVMLMGHVPSEQQKMMAEKMAKSTEDVKSVKNMLQVRAEN